MHWSFVPQSPWPLQALAEEENRREGVRMRGVRSEVAERRARARDGRSARRRTALGERARGKERENGGDGAEHGERARRGREEEAGWARASFRRQARGSRGVGVVDAPHFRQRLVLSRATPPRATPACPLAPALFQRFLPGSRAHAALLRVKLHLDARIEQTEPLDKPLPPRDADEDLL